MIVSPQPTPADPLSVAASGVAWLCVATGLDVCAYPTHGQIEFLWTWRRLGGEGNLRICPLVSAGSWPVDPPFRPGERCPAGGSHTWGWHAEDGSGRPVTPGAWCDECGAQGPDDLSEQMLRNRIAAQRVQALRS